MNLDHASQQKELYCKLTSLQVSLLEIRGYTGYPFCTPRVWEYIVTNSWLEESDLRDWVVRSKWLWTTSKRHHFRKEKELPVSMHAVCRKAKQHNELTSISLNLPGEEINSVAALITNCKNVHNAIYILFRELSSLSYFDKYKKYS